MLDFHTLTMKKQATPDANPCHLYEDEAEPAGSGYYYLEDFIMSGTNKIECYMDYKTVSSQGQEFTVLRLVIPANTTLYSTKNGTCKLYLFAYTEQGPSIIVDENDDYVDIEFWYSQGAWILPQGENWGVAWINSSTNRGSWIIEPILVPTNGTYESVEIIDMDDQGNITDYNEVSTEIYAEFNLQFFIIYDLGRASFARLRHFDVYGIDTRDGTLRVRKNSRFSN